MSAVLRLVGMSGSADYEVALLGMADVLLGTMRSSARGDCDRRRAHHLLTCGHDVSTLFDRQRRPRPEGPLRGHTGHDQGRARCSAQIDAELGLARLAQGPGPHRHHHVEPDVEGTDPPLDEGVARKGGLARARGTAGPGTPPPRARWPTARWPTRRCPPRAPWAAPYGALRPGAPRARAPAGRPPWISKLRPRPECATRQTTTWPTADQPPPNLARESRGQAQAGNRVPKVAPNPSHRRRGATTLSGKAGGGSGGRGRRRW